MYLTLRRIKFHADGIFGQLLYDNNIIAITLEHAYRCFSDWIPKIPIGNYPCVRGMHRLENMTEDFETFEIKNISNCTGILFHIGNYNRDSHGCVLLGKAIDGNMITNSKETFENFMDMLKGINQFELIITRE